MKMIAKAITFVAAALTIGVLPLRAEETIKHQQKVTAEQNNRGRVTCKLITLAAWPDSLKIMSRACTISENK